MAILKVENKELTFFLDKLSCVIDFNKDLPVNVFVGGEYLFWFFDRPLLCFVDIFKGLILESVSSYSSNVFIKFSGGEPLVNSCYSVDGSDVDKDVSWISKRFENFFDGKIGYPIILCSSTCDWIAYESAREEFGVIAVKASTLQENFHDYLNSSFISMDELVELASGSSVESLTAKAFIFSYRS